MSASVLVVDDEPLNLEIIAEYLADSGHSLTLTGGGEEAWARLDGDPYGYDLVLLDRMMPVLDGMALLRRIKDDERLRHLPVVMQTAAASAEQISEGLEAGAYYYLIKPFEPETLTAIVRAALGDRARWVALTERIASHTTALSLVDAASFSIQTLTEAEALAGLVALMSDRPEEVAMGLAELLVNGVEHGNLGIDFAEKSALKNEERWNAEIERRLALPENRHKRVRLEIQREATGWRVLISDEGTGFDWEPFLELSPDRAFAPNGRGIALSRRMSFRQMHYLGCGNRVELHIGAADAADSLRGQA
ncbi:response regulator [Uliginosibacterium sp. H1]|uniref:response regulator n=1 Tax=Uliginosibacterium sp. H1 TaxID=3114757 RepID=UPI002E181CAE|nr:response regulator [Uliginosibacterium sp. H1]